MAATKDRDTKETGLVPVTHSYPALAGGGERAAALRENLGGDKISVNDLNRIKVPAGGGTYWQVPTAEGEKPQQYIEGIVVAIERRRTYWASSGTAGTPPDCYSLDAVKGVGNPGGVCDTCPMNAWGSARKPDGSPGRGKSCKETRLFFVLREGEILPDVVSVPPGSFSTIRPFLLRLHRPIRSLVTRLGLKREKSKDGIDYAQVVPTVVRELSAEEAAAADVYAHGLAAMIGGVMVDRNDVDD